MLPFPSGKTSWARASTSSPIRTFTVPDGIEFVEVDQATGTLVTEPSQETTTEVFADGTVPQPPVRQPADPLDFYELDQLDEAVETH